MLQSIFIDLMPEHCRAILAAFKHYDLAELALLADKVMETVDPAAVHSAAAGAVNSAAVHAVAAESAHLAAVTPKTSPIQEQIDGLAREFASFKVSMERSLQSLHRNIS